MLLANQVIADMLKHAQFKAALEEMANHELSAIGTPACSTTFTAHLDGGAKTVRRSENARDAATLCADRQQRIEKWSRRKRARESHAAIVRATGLRAEQVAEVKRRVRA